MFFWIGNKNNIYTSQYSGPPGILMDEPLLMWLCGFIFLASCTKSNYLPCHGSDVDIQWHYSIHLYAHDLCACNIVNLFIQWFALRATLNVWTSVAGSVLSHQHHVRFEMCLFLITLTSLTLKIILNGRENRQASSETDFLPTSVSMWHPSHTSYFCKACYILPSWYSFYKACTIITFQREQNYKRLFTKKESTQPKAAGGQKLKKKKNQLGFIPSLLINR